VWFLWLYLVAYVSLVAGAVAALWRAGALAQVPTLWTVLGLLAALGLGALLALTFIRRPART
jgi:hypothetical protein